MWIAFKYYAQEKQASLHLYPYLKWQLFKSSILKGVIKASILTEGQVGLIAAVFFWEVFLNTCCPAALNLGITYLDYHKLV